jgi:predicted component of type VI protein secretion system
VASFVPLTAGESFWPVFFPLTEPEIFIGRLPECGIRSTDESVSRRHARLVFHEGQWWAEDLESRNGVVINGQSVASAILAEGDIVRIGDQYFAYSAVDFPDDAAADAWRGVYVERAQALHAALPIPPHLASAETAVAVVAQQRPQAPIPPASFTPAAPALSAAPVTRAYPPRVPQSSAKVSAILRLPGSTTGVVAGGVRPGTPLVPIPPTSVPGAVPGVSSVKVINVTGPDYVWYAVIGLAVVVLIAAVVIFFSQKARREAAALPSLTPVEHIVSQQLQRAAGQLG